MFDRKRSRVLMAALLVGLPGLAAAEEATTPTHPMATQPAEMPGATHQSVPEKSALYDFQGWVDTSLVWDDLATGQANKVGFQLAQVGLRMGHKIDEHFGGFVQLNAFFGGARAAGLVAREAYGSYTDGGFTLLAGKFYAPIGFELADPPDLYQFSNSLVFNNMIPTELVGAKAAIQFSDALDLQLYVAGPWDDDASALAVGTKNLGLRLGIGFGDVGGIGLSAVGGPNDANGDGTVGEGELRAAIDLDGSFTFGDLLLGLEANLNLIEQGYPNASTFATPFGFLVMVNYTFGELFNLTLRYDMIRDAGFADGAPGALFGDATPQTYSSVTVGPNFHLADGWDVFTELRYDMASDDVFTLSDGTAANGYLSGAVELIYQF